MRSKHFRLLCAVTMIMMAMLACNLGSPGGAPTAEASATPQTEQAVPTVTATELLTATATLEPTEAATATPTLTPEPSLTPTVDVPVAQVLKDAKCHTGPSGAYDVVLTLKADDTVKVLGRDLGGYFVFVENPNEPEQGCWVLQTSVTISGDLAPLPAFTAPPSPTLAPNFTIKYKNIDKCGANFFTRFIVVNTGSVGFRSAYVKVTNLKNNEVTEQSVLAFDLTVGCVVAQNITPLGVGQTGYLQSAVFQKVNPKGQKMRAVFQLCTEQFLKGACVNQVLEFVAK